MVNTCLGVFRVREEVPNLNAQERSSRSTPYVIEARFAVFSEAEYFRLSFQEQ